MEKDVKNLRGDNQTLTKKVDELNDKHSRTEKTLTVSQENLQIKVSNNATNIQTALSTQSTFEQEIIKNDQGLKQVIANLSSKIDRLNTKQRSTENALQGKSID